MPGLVPGIHVSKTSSCSGREKPGHDVAGARTRYGPKALIAAPNLKKFA